MRNQWGTLDVPARTAAVEVAANVGSRILPWPMTVMDVQAEVVGPATSGTITLDVLANGVSMLLVKLFIEAGEITSQVSTVQPAFVAATGSTALARQVMLPKGTLVTVDVLEEGSGDASWLRVVLLGIQHIDGATVSPPPPPLVQVTINQASGQPDPTSAAEVEFDVVFSESVTGFTDADVTLSGTAGATTAVVSGAGSTYTVTVSGMSTSGSVIATIAAGVCVSSGGIPNQASQSTDNNVSWTAPGLTTFNAYAASLGPTHWWKANESSGNLANSGSGTGTGAPAGTPNYDQALGAFDSVNLDGTTAEYFAFNPSPLVDDQPFSMFIMVRPDVLPASGESRTIMHTGGDGSSSIFFKGFLLVLSNDLGVVFASLAKNSGTRQESTSAALAAANTPITIGYTWTGTTTKLYVNGVLRDSDSYSGGVDHQGFRIGYHLGTNSAPPRNALDGRWANALWWQNTTISDAQMAELHAASGL